MALVLWLSWQKPTWLFLLALASLAIRPQLFWGGPAVGYEWGLHQTLLVYALAVNALRYGVRRTPNWPILALLATFCLSLAFGNLHPKLTLPLMLESLAILALPFAFTQVVLEPGSRRACALVIMLTPLLSVALGGLLHAAAIHGALAQEPGMVFRLQGATGDAAVFGVLAFSGFAVGLHEAMRRGRRYAGYLAVLDLALVILSGTRMAMLASAVLLGAYATISEELRARLRAHRAKLLIGTAVVAATFLGYWPMLETRTVESPDGILTLSGRDLLWKLYYGEFLLSPVFGRGIGAGFVGANGIIDWPVNWPHNEYLHLLVIGGIVGVALFGTGLALWYRHLLQVASPNDRSFLVALAPALAAYAVTDNVLIYTSALPLYAYLGVVLTQPGILQDVAPVSRSPEPQPTRWVGEHAPES